MNLKTIQNNLIINTYIQNLYYNNNKNIKKTYLCRRLIVDIFKEMI